MLVGDDIVVTALHCTPDVQPVPARLMRPAVQVGDTLILDVRVACQGVRIGRVLSLVGNVAIVDTYACPGNSGSPVFNAGGQLVGVVVRRILPNDTAVVELF